MSRKLHTHIRNEATQVDLSQKVLTDIHNSHPKMIFVCALTEESESPETVTVEATLARQLTEVVDNEQIPELNLILDSYVRMSYLPPDLQTKIREFLGFKPEEASVTVSAEINEDFEVSTSVDGVPADGTTLTKDV